MASNRINKEMSVEYKVDKFLNGGTIKINNEDVVIKALHKGKAALSSRQSFVPYGEMESRTYSAYGKQTLTDFHNELVNDVIGE